MSALPTPSPSRRRLLTPYVLVWVAVAGLAMAYLALLGLKPAIFARSAKAADDIEQQLAQTQPRHDARIRRPRSAAAHRRRDEARRRQPEACLRRGIGARRADHGEGERAGGLHAERARGGAGRRYRERHRGPGGNASACSGTRSATDGRQTQGIGACRRYDTGTAEGRQADQRRPEAHRCDRNRQHRASRQGSRAQGRSRVKPITVKPPAVKPAAKSTPVGVLLATGPTVDSLRLNWSILTDRHGDAVRTCGRAMS